MSISPLYNRMRARYAHNVDASEPLPPTPSVTHDSQSVRGLQTLEAWIYILVSLKVEEKGDDAGWQHRIVTPLRLNWYVA